MMITLLFVCIENSNRSQMAEAFARMYGEGNVQAFSAGSHPSGKINPKAISAMKELGYDLTVHHSKSLEDIPALSYDYVIGMGCGDDCPFIPARHRLEWDIPDPKHMDEAAFRKVRDRIGQEVRQLLADCL